MCVSGLSRVLVDVVAAVVVVVVGMAVVVVVVVVVVVIVVVVRLLVLMVWPVLKEALLPLPRRWKRRRLWWRDGKNRAKNVKMKRTTRDLSGGELVLLPCPAAT
jgi:ABC-type bacteriocin/lantibiotic exporter with double-glycine peptidase domain